ncbi:MAG: hypothetical protein ACOYUZ_06365 [Patescibacteria group bacterium]
MQDLVTKINDQITRFSNNKVVVGIDGCSGIGKTTLLNELKKRNPDIPAVYRDDFIIPRREFEKKLKRASDKSEVFETQIVDTEKLRSLIKAFRIND